MSFFTNCKKASAACARGELDSPNTLERLGFRLHYVICPFCRSYRRQLELIERLFKEKWGSRSDSGRLTALQARLSSLLNSL
jgi:hypothetical protein